MSLLSHCHVLVSAAECKAHGRRFRNCSRQKILVSTKKSKVDTVTESNFLGRSANEPVVLVHVKPPLASAAP